MVKEYSFKVHLWLYPGMAGWHFVTLPKNISEEIDFFFNHIKKGWGSIPVLVSIGKTSWKTSIFPDKKIGSFLLPIKAQVRKQEELFEGDSVLVMLKIKDYTEK